MTEERFIRVVGGCKDCESRYSDMGTGYTQYREDGSIKDVYCLRDPEQRECINDEFPAWCPLEQYAKNMVDLLTEWIEDIKKERELETIRDKIMDYDPEAIKSQW